MNIDEFEKPTDFSREVLSRSKPGLKFQPFAHYEPEGDFVEVIFSDADYKAKRVDSTLTVYLDQVTGEQIGGMLKGVSRLVKKLPGLSKDFEKGRIPMAQLISLFMWLSDPAETKQLKVYRSLRDRASRDRLETDYLQEA
jgi:hypothetical protein